MDILHPVPPSQPPTLIPSPNAGTKKKSRLSYSINFKLAAVRHAETHGNRATARYLGINEKQIRDWRSKKTSLMNTNANAKRLKGAGRQSSGADHNRRGKVANKKSLDEATKAFTWLQPSQSTRTFFDSNKHFSWWRDWSPREHDVSIDSNIIKLPAVNNNNNDYITTEKHYVKSPSLPTVRTANFPSIPLLHKEEEREEKDYKEKISCALALLELKSTSKKSMYPHPFILW